MSNVSNTAKKLMDDALLSAKGLTISAGSVDELILIRQACYTARKRQRKLDEKTGVPTAWDSLQFNIEASAGVATLSIVPEAELLSRITVKDKASGEDVIV